MISHTIQSLRDFYDSGKTRPVEFRIEALKSLKNAITRNIGLLERALFDDLGKSQFESYTTELGIVISEIDYHIRNLKNWVKPQRVRTPLFVMPARSRIMFEPLGIALIISPWNYPLQLTLNPLIGAISAGNCTVLKPSPKAPASAAAIDKIISETFPKDYICTVQGQNDVMDTLLAQRFDYIFYTGGEAFGRKVMQAAANHLTPITLELGGKSPCIVDKTADLEIAARRIGWGKYLNAGQTCVAPDYVLVHKDVKQPFIEKLQTSVIRFFGTDPIKSPDYPRIIDRQSMFRLSELIKDERVIFGGNYDIESRFFAPTAIEVCDTNCPIMEQEIFGPILPIIEYDNLQCALDFINGREKPLALYYFGSPATGRKTIANTSSGGACINDTVMHLANNRLPFGGIGNSGIGKYHGKNSFDTFSNRRAILTSSTMIDIPLRYAPYKLLGLVKRLL